MAVSTVDSVQYLDPAGVQLTRDNVTVLDSSAAITALGGTLTSGWYVVEGTVNYPGTITISGDVHLILADGSSLSATGLPARAGIEVTTGNRLDVYAQSTGTETGSLTATGGSINPNRAPAPIVLSSLVLALTFFSITTSHT